MIIYNKKVILLVSLILIFSCTTHKSVKPTEPVQNTYIIEKESIKVWNALIDVLIDQKYQIENLDQETGIITTKTKNLNAKITSQYTYHEFDGIYGLLDEFEQQNTFRVKPMDNNTEIKILSTFKGRNIKSNGEAQNFDLETNGHFEKNIIDAIKNKIAK